MATLDQDVAAIREAVYGREIREAIADGLLRCKDEVDKKASEEFIRAEATKIAGTTDDYVLNVVMNTP